MKEVSPDDKWQDTDPSEPDLSPEDCAIMQTITLMRMYDIMLARFVEEYPSAGRKMMELHARGGLMGPPPMIDPAQVVQYGEDIGND